jgi:hypothetical protein
MDNTPPSCENIGQRLPEEKIWKGEEKKYENMKEIKIERVTSWS